jgi:hypothetical protein
LTALSACSLIAASCAQTAPIIAADQGAQAATVAATEAVATVAQAATQIYNAISTPTGAIPVPVPAGTTVVETATSYLLIQNGQVTIIEKSAMYGYTGAKNGK